MNIQLDLSQPASTPTLPLSSSDSPESITSDPSTDSASESHNECEPLPNLNPTVPLSESSSSNPLDDSEKCVCSNDFSELSSEKISASSCLDDPPSVSNSSKTLTFIQTEPPKDILSPNQASKLKPCAILRKESSFRKKNCLPCSAKNCVKNSSLSQITAKITSLISSQNSHKELPTCEEEVEDEAEELKTTEVASEVAVQPGEQIELAEVQPQIKEE